MKKAKEKITSVQFRYYDMPVGEYEFALFGDKWRRNYGNDVLEHHFHNYMEIGICREGNGILDINGADYLYHGGMISIIPENILHTTVSATTECICFWEYLFIDVRGFFSDYFGGDELQTSRMVEKVNSVVEFCNIEDAMPLYRIAETILDEEKNKKHGSTEIIKGLLQAFLLKLAGYESGQTKIETPDDQTKLSQVRNALFYMQKHCEEHLQIEELADLCHLSETHFRRVFGECMHMAPLEYLNYLRVNKACDLLQKTEYAMDVVAEKAGFQTQSSFIRNFRRYLDMTPYQWKKQSAGAGKKREFKITAYKGW